METAPATGPPLPGGELLPIVPLRPDRSIVLDAESREVVSVNQAAVAQYGYAPEEFIGLSILRVRPPEGQTEAERILSEIPHGSWRTTAVEHVRKNGTRFSVDVWSKDTEVDGRMVRVCTINDVTDRVRMQSELQRAQKMELVGRLAGGIAHDFNNALASILGGADLLADQLSDDPAAMQEIQDIRDAAQRAARLTRQLLAFGRKQLMRPEPARLDQVVTRVQGLLERVMPPEIHVRTRLEAGGWPVRVDTGQLELALMSLAVNAREAMPDGGTLLLATRNVSLGRDDEVQGLRLPAGDYASLVVGDTGVGMDELTLARVFEPFFTTRGPTERRGLGLAMTYGIIRQSGGFITVDSTPGEGTTFHILLPRTEAEARSEEPTPAPPVDPRARTVLVVDDDEAVRRGTVRVVEELGATVLSATSGEEAMEVARRSGRTPDLVILGLGEPGPGERELADALAGAFPEIRVLFMSGYSADFGGHAGLLDHGVGFLQKPFSVDSLTAMVRKLLAER